jgi:hypothetical protein
MLPTNTYTVTLTGTPSWTPTITQSPTVTGTPTATPLVTNTSVPTLTLTPNAPMYLSANFFNPATGETLGMDILVQQAGPVKIMVYNLLGEEVIKIADQNLNNGSYHFTWDGRNTSENLVGNGVYFVLIEQPSGNFIRKVIVLK